MEKVIKEVERSFGTVCIVSWKDICKLIKTLSSETGVLQQLWTDNKATLNKHRFNATKATHLALEYELRLPTLLHWMTSMD